MKNLFLIVIVTTLFLSCKENQPKEPEATSPEVAKSIDTSKYPQDLVKIFETHGGIEKWSTFENLCFEIEKEGGNEVHTTLLKSRKTTIEHPDWTIGYDGSNVWLLNQKENAYQGNARFYHNLMFYFYAMPFILADDGIQYTAIEKQELMGVTYEGIKIGYDSGIGDTPDDEYIIYYNPDTYQMEWLAYTVTFGKEGKSDVWKFIKYGDWQTVNDVILPKTLTWYNVEDGVPVSKRNDLNFVKVTATETLLDETTFDMPEGSVVVPR